MNNITFVQMPSVPFDWMVQRPQQIMSKLARRGYRVFYFDSKIEGISLRKNNLYLVGRNYSMNNINTDGKVVLWCSSPKQVVNIDKIPHDYVVYDVVDDASSEFKAWNEFIPSMINRADIIFTTAEKLYDKFKKVHPKVFLINNGLDVGNFSLNKKEIPRDLPKGRPIVGYVGAVAKWIDWELISNITKKSFYNFVFVGPFYNRFKPNLIRSNIYYLGLKEYEKLPYYINNFDCCMIPFKINEMTNSCNPVKLYEYISLGKPVVTTDMYELRRFSSICYIAKNTDEFKKSIEDAVREKSREVFLSRIKVAKQNSWDARVDEIVNILNQQLIIS